LKSDWEHFKLLRDSCDGRFCDRQAFHVPRAECPAVGEGHGGCPLGALPSHLRLR
jgi:hypothetical protein